MGNVTYLKKCVGYFYFSFLYIQGGSKQLELLNSISRDNYTMLTVKRYIHALFHKNDKLI